MEIITNTALISINATLFVQVASFLIFLFVMNRLMFRPLRKTMRDRSKYVSDLEQEIDDAERDIVRYFKEIEKQRAAARAEAHSVTAELEEEGNDEAHEIIESAVKEISVLKKKTKKQIDAQISEARELLLKETEALSVQIMEKVLDRRLSHEAVE
jgi:F-type H+-transporting ATPase subunit b